MRVIVVLLLCVMLLRTQAYEAKRIRKMMNEIYYKTENELLNTQFSRRYADIIYRRSRSSVDIDSELLPESLNHFSLIKPAPIHIALALKKYRVFESIMTVLEEVEPEGYDTFPPYLSVTFPLSDNPKDDKFLIPEERAHLPQTWLDHQWITIEGSFPLKHASIPAFCSVLGDVHCLRLTHEWGAQPHIAGNANGAPDALIVASERDDAALIAELVRLGAPLATTARVHVALPSHPAHHAALGGHTRALQALLDAGVPVDIRGAGGGDTPLMCAAREGHSAAVQLLLARGADPRLVHMRDRHSAHSLAEQFGHAQVARLIAETVRARGWRVHHGPSAEQRMLDVRNRALATEWLEQKYGSVTPEVEAAVAAEHTGELDALDELATLPRSPLASTTSTSEDAVRALAVGMARAQTHRVHTHNVSRDSLASRTSLTHAPTHAPTQAVTVASAPDLTAAVQADAMYDGWQPAQPTEATAQTAEPEAHVGDPHAAPALAVHTDMRVVATSATSHDHQTNHSNTTDLRAGELALEESLASPVVKASLPTSMDTPQQAPTHDAGTVFGLPRADVILGKNVAHYLVRLDDGTVHRAGTHSFRAYLQEKQAQEASTRAAQERVAVELETDALRTVSDVANNTTILKAEL